MASFYAMTACNLRTRRRASHASGRASRAAPAANHVSGSHEFADYLKPGFSIAKVTCSGHLSAARFTETK